MFTCIENGPASADETAKVILICGKICSGKTTYAKKLARELKGVRLSCDEIMLSLFGQHLGDRHEEILGKTLTYLFKKSLELRETGIPVIIDYGFWQRGYREEANEFYAQHSLKPEWHYIDVTPEVWRRNIDRRNEAVLKNETADYFVDEHIIAKFQNPLDEPTKEEMDVWFVNQY
jgi:predicted kinase